MPKSRSPRQNKETPATKKACYFCTSGTEPVYKDVVALRRFVSSRSKIVPKLRSGLCAKHQRKLTQEVKRARHLALLSFSAGV